jgi:O-antigen ligase
MNRYDFPTSFGGIQGLNLWNILFANVFLAWLANRRRQGLLWDMPTHINVFLVLWLGVILVGWVRMMFSGDRPEDLTLANLISERLINMIKWPLLALLLFDGCRTRGRIKLALACILLLFALFAVQIVRYVPPMVVLEPGNLRHRGNIPDDMGISINGASKMMSGVPWAMLAIMPLLKRRKYRFLLLGACVTSLYVVALTGSRSGYIACAATLVLLCFLRWRRYLLLLPFVVLILPIAVPGAAVRMLTGFGEIDVAGEKITNEFNVTTGRNLIWKHVISKICESPVFGFGREATRRSGVREEFRDEERDVDVAHPHNAYLEVLLDNGLIGFVIIVGLHMVIWVYSVRLFVDRGDPLYTAVGGFTLALLTGHLVAFMGGQSFYPEAIDVGLWCAIGVMFRLHVERDRLVAKANDISSQYTYYQGHYSVTNTVGLG